MSTTVVDLWPEDLQVPDETTPAILMRQQAEVLGQRTKGRVEAEVITQPLDHSQLAHYFRLRATALGGYVHSLFVVTHHKAQPYPVKVQRLLPADIDSKGRIQECNNEAELEQILRELFASTETRKAVETLLAA